MLYRRLLSTLVLLCVQISGQSVISVHSGLIHFSEGLVFIDDRPLAPSYGRFPEIGENSVLRTEKGRAEILLTPGVFLRIGENSVIRMISSSLSDTQVEFLKGSAIVQSKDILPDNSVILIYRDWKIRLPKQGLYRIDSEPQRLKVYSGDAELSLGKEIVVVNEGRLFSFSTVVAERFATEPDDLDRWAKERSSATAAPVGVAAPTGTSKRSSGPRVHPSVLPRRTW
jgi:hypothetical protein